MKLIFVRHGEPNYELDTLTENGWKEAELLSERISKWNVTEFYVSPMGRAHDTSKATLDKMQRTAIELPYLREFSYRINDTLTGRAGVPWDFVPSDWTSDDNMFIPGDGFLSFKYIKENADIQREYYNVIESFDKLLEGYGYVRDGRIYRNMNITDMRHIPSTVCEENKALNKKDINEPLLVFFCHLGVTCLILSHLINISFEVLAHGFYLPPTSLTVLTTEERWENEAYFRVQSMGDTHHLLSGGQHISPAGLFGSVFEG